MTALAPITADLRQRRVERALAGNATLDRIIDVLTELKNDRIRAAQKNDYFFQLRQEYALCGLIDSYFQSDDMADRRADIAHELRSEYSFDIVEGCDLDDAGEPVREAW
jgi:hypothetical protein